MILETGTYKIHNGNFCFYVLYQIVKSFLFCFIYICN